MKNNLQMLINKASFKFHKCFINNNNELIIEPRNNIYFRLEDVETEKDFICKVIAYCSRSCTKGVSLYWQRYMREGVNFLLETNFSAEDFEYIYTYLGCDHTRQRLIDFVDNSMSIEWLRKEVQDAK